MKKELIIELLKRFEQACYIYKGIEYWKARELQEILGYSQWRNFVNAIDKAKAACTNAGESVANHFAEVSKMVEIGSNTIRTIEDVALSRYACYLIAQNGDASKPLNH